MILLLAGGSTSNRLLGTRWLVTIVARRWPQAQFLRVTRATAILLKSSAIAEIYWLALAHSQWPARASTELCREDVRPSGGKADSNKAMLALARAHALYTVGRYRDATEQFSIVASINPDLLKLMSAALTAAFASSLLREKNRSMFYFSIQYDFLSPEESCAVALLEPEPGELDIIRKKIIERAAKVTLPCLIDNELDFEKTGKIGVFFLSSVHALGHAVLDPYHFLALRAQNYGKIYFVGPPRDSYRPSTAACLEIVGQYGTYLETHDAAALNLSWMSLGTLAAGKLEVVVEHYWSLLREAVQRHRDPSDAFRHNVWHLRLPERFVDLGRQFAASHTIDLDQPIVVLHARHMSYHKLHAQSHRDADVERYLPAVRYLLNAGYQVIRIGDQDMPRLPLSDRHYMELPFVPGYCPELDSFFIRQAAFMIGCQSGPCAYARALGAPILSVNAVLHYTLLPSPMEMGCFKRYYRRRNNAREPLSLEDALEARVFHFDNSHQFAEAGIEVEDAQLEEILAAVKDMIAWVEAPDLPETDAQRRFRAAVEAETVALQAEGSGLALPIADYVGMSLPGYRISPTVAEMRS